MTASTQTVLSILIILIILTIAIAIAATIGTIKLIKYLIRYNYEQKIKYQNEISELNNKQN